MRDEYYVDFDELPEIDPLIEGIPSTLQGIKIEDYYENLFMDNLDNEEEF